MGNSIMSSIKNSYLDNYISNAKEEILENNRFIIANESQLSVANILLVIKCKEAGFSDEDIEYIKTKLFTVKDIHKQLAVAI
jgi:hypothetical protein